MDKVRFGVIGLGNMGGWHAKALAAKAANAPGGIENATLTAVCDIDAAKVEQTAKATGARGFATHNEMMDSKLVDAVIIATPHYDHPPIAIDAFSRGIHVMSEKPIAVSVNAARKLNEEYKAKYSHLKFGIMFQSRTSPVVQKVRELIKDGDLGEITRLTWLATSWFRTWTYYASGGWRATWKGEGGGVLINQCPHNLDVIQWLMGDMPKRVTAVASIGKTHPIEVEDEVSAILEYPNGAIGHFVTTTGEAPGTDRLEIAGDRGKVVVENSKLMFYRTRQSVREVNQKSPESFADVESWPIEIAVGRGPGVGSAHAVVLTAFVKAILNGDKMLADGVEGVRGLELGNAMLMAGITGKPVDLPMDGAAYDQFLLQLEKQYGGKKTLTTREGVVDFSNSFHGN